MAEVTMDMAELDQMRNEIKTLKEKVDLNQAEIEANKKTVYVEHRRFTASFNYNAFIKDLREMPANDRSRWESEEDRINRALNNYGSKYITVSDSATSSKTFVGLDEISSEIRKELEDKFENDLRCAKRTVQEKSKQLEELDKKLLESSRSTDVLVRERTLHIVEKDQKELLDLEKKYNEMKFSLEKQISTLQFENDQLKKEDVREQLKTTSTDLNHAYIDRDKLRDIILDLHKQLKRFEKKSLIGKMMFDFDYNKQLL